MENQLQMMEPVAKSLAATAISQTLSFCMERKYLTNIDNTQLNGVFKIEAVPTKAPLEASWIQIKQVGKPLDDSADKCFTAIQKILYSCFLPKQTQLMFLITGDGKECKMYLGLRSVSDDIKAKSISKSLNEFMKGAWPGLQTEVVSEEDEGLQEFVRNAKSDGLEYVYAFTGIPSMESQYKSLYPATIDQLITGMSKSKNYAYLVVADPVPNEDSEAMLYSCREMNGQAESLKSINITEGFTHGTSISNTQSKTASDTVSHTVTESLSKKDFTKLGKAAMSVTGLGLAASIMPAAADVLTGVATTAAELAPAALNVMGFGMIGNAISNLMPSKTTGTSDTESHTDSTTESQTIGQNESRQQSASRNIVNKHIEAVSEHLFYHSKRIESGKAIGMWKVGVYLMANKKSDINGGSLQLRSILSGQESIYEPIRMHDVSQIVDGDIKNTSIARFSSPLLMVRGINGSTFNHPLGEHYTEMKTVLTTKELSYLINFPLHSVAGISVVNSCPDFCLNAQENNDGIEFGKIINGGSSTKIPYSINPAVLSRHTLITGINGSGKTNTVQAILNGIKDMPFLVIEPAKTEYVDWALEYNKQHPQSPITIYIPGCKNYRGVFTPEALKINPFEPVWLNAEQDPNVLTHIDRLKSTFAAAFPMYDILPVLMEDLIYSIYQNKSTDWLGSAPEFGRTQPPTLNSMSVNVEKVINAHQYEERIGRNMMACLNTRIDSLRRGWKGEMLGCVHSTPYKEIYERPVVINLSYVGDDVDKSFFMALILQQLYEYRQALAETGAIDFNDNRCRHLTIIEEAHRVMAKCENVEQPQYKTAMMFSNMLSEIRAYGEGFMLVDQVPTRLIPDAVKNTNLKICHRMVAEDDCKAIGESMSLSEEQRRLIPKLLTGQCIVSSSYETSSYWVKADKVK